MVGAPRAVGASSRAHAPNKRLGQHFLRDRSALAEVAAAIAPRTGQHFFEIGCGDGALTGKLLAEGASVCGVEIDRHLEARLNKRFLACGERWRLIAGDALEVDWAAATACATNGARMAGNLPYSIATPLLFRAFANLDLVCDMHFMVQREVARRLAAECGGSSYGRLSVMAQCHCEVECLFDLAPSCFYPAPKVWSSLVRLRPCPRRIAPESARRLKAMTRAAFGQRRKTLRRSLASVVKEDEWRELGIDPSMRPQQLSVAQFVALGDRFGERLVVGAER